MPAGALVTVPVPDFDTVSLAAPVPDSVTEVEPPGVAGAVRVPAAMGANTRFTVQLAPPAIVMQRLRAWKSPIEGRPVSTGEPLGTSPVFCTVHVWEPLVSPGAVSG